MLKWVEEAVQASKVHLLSTDHLNMAVNTWQIPFDPSLREVTVSLSGPSPVIEIHDPLGEVIYTLFCDSKKKCYFPTVSNRKALFVVCRSLSRFE